MSWTEALFLSQSVCSKEKFHSTTLPQKALLGYIQLFDNWRSWNRVYSNLDSIYEILTRNNSTIGHRSPFRRKMTNFDIRFHKIKWVTFIYFELKENPVKLLKFSNKSTNLANFWFWHVVKCRLSKFYIMCLGWLKISLALAR